MDVAITDLYEDRPAVGQQIAGTRKSISKVGQVRVNLQFPGVSKRLHLFRLPSRIFAPTIFDIPFACGHLPVGPELDAVWWIDINHLDFAPQTLLFREGRHNEKRVTQDQAVGPALRVAVEFDK